MKDRIKQIMESQHMTQQVFADFIGIAPATLSGIFTERTKPTLNTVEAIKRKLPLLSTDWLMFGRGPMFTDSGAAVDANPSTPAPKVEQASSEPMLDFGQPAPINTPQFTTRPVTSPSVAKSARMEVNMENLNNFEKTQRKVTEIRVFYDDQTWESFVPAKK
ncbi:MAG: helix-turn-helix transcriptional regulator [Prevotella sp.]|nr:helix-turn-helix transcriptional regulator [Prevotella sp.]